MIPFPNKQYEIIYADPPWSYQCTMTNKDKEPTSRADDHYPTMTLDEIIALPVKDITAENCLLFMWTSSPHLDQSIEVGTAWGFKYTTIGFIWDKQRAIPGFYTMSQCEICLIFKRGKIPKPRGARNIRQFFSCHRGKHSEKPWEIRERIYEMFPEQEKIELFSRQVYPGWDAWGNEKDGNKWVPSFQSGPKIEIRTKNTPQQQLFEISSE